LKHDSGDTHTSVRPNGRFLSRLALKRAVPAAGHFQRLIFFSWVCRRRPAGIGDYSHFRHPLAIGSIQP
jgi:hypothetical protein